MGEGLAARGLLMLCKWWQRGGHWLAPAPLVWGSHGQSQPGALRTSARLQIRATPSMRKRKSHAASAPLVSREDWAQLRPVATLAVALWAVATALRTARATRGLAVAQPDQVFQGVEMAHVLWYGYGLVPFEYMPGVALRSHIMPAVYAAVMGISDKLSLPYHSALGALNAVKAFHCAWASTSVLLVVAYVRHLGCTYQAALAAGAVVALHPLLTGLDCLTLSNPFVTPLCLLVCLLADVALDHDAPSRRRRCLAAGILAGITCHVRADSVIVLLPGLLLSPRWTSRFMYSPSMAALRARVQDAVWTVQGGSVAVLGTFMLDSHMFGHWTWAPVRMRGRACAWMLPCVLACAFLPTAAALRGTVYCWPLPHAAHPSSCAPCSGTGLCTTLSSPPPTFMASSPRGSSWSSTWARSPRWAWRWARLSWRGPSS